MQYSIYLSLVLAYLHFLHKLSEVEYSSAKQLEIQNFSVIDKNYPYFLQLSAAGLIVIH